MKLLNSLLKDNFSGSGMLLFKTQEILLLMGQSEEEIDTESLMKDLAQLKKQFPLFAVLQHFVNEMEFFIRQRTYIEGEQLVLRIENYRKQWQHAQQKANEKLLTVLPFEGKNILLHSNSSALQSLFAELAKRKIFPTLWQTVSAPVNEGLLQAKVLKRLGFKVNLFHEVAFSKFARNIDFAIFGADVVTDTFFINKVGTYPLALMMKQENKPVFVLAEIRKRRSSEEVNPKELLLEMPKSPKEIIENPEGLTVHNFYFEATPLSLIKQVFTESDPA
jgi:translation initiation factor 2B subunit (eIF-2B alpha/beta/delta family)